MTAYEEGVKHRNAGRSEHYNPYRNTPADGRYGEWIEGRESADSNLVPTPTQ